MLAQFRRAGRRQSDRLRTDVEGRSHERPSPDRGGAARRRRDRASGRSARLSAPEPLPETLLQEFACTKRRCSIICGMHGGRSQGNGLALQPGRMSNKGSSPGPRCGAAAHHAAAPHLSGTCLAAADRRRRAVPGRLGGQAAALGWPAWELFGCHRRAPWGRIQGMGLVLLLRGDEIAALTATEAVIRTATGARQTYRRSRATRCILRSGVSCGSSRDGGRRPWSARRSAPAGCSNSAVAKSWWHNRA